MLENVADLELMARPYLAEFNAICAEHELLTKVNVDHVCLRCSSHEIFQNTRDLFEKDSRFIFQSVNGGRPIAVVGLTSPLHSALGEIKYLELSDQKPDGSQKDQIDHVEIVPITMSYEEMKDFFENKGFEIKKIVRPHHTSYEFRLPKTGFLVRLSEELLIDKIKREEMV